MNWFDGVILASIVLVALIGWRLGLIQSAVMAAGIILGSVVAAPLSGVVAGLLKGTAADTPARVLAYAFIAIGVFAIVQIAGALMTGLANAVFLGPLNRMGGAAAGLAAGLILGAVLTAFAAHLAFSPDTSAASASPEEMRDWARDGVTASAMSGAYARVYHRLPEAALAPVPDELDEGMHRLEGFRASSQAMVRR